MFFVYLLASQPHGTLYIGSTSDLVRRVWEHKTKAVPGFTAKYDVDRLVWFEAHDTLGRSDATGEADQKLEAILENRAYRKDNPDWIDLYASISR